MDKNAGFRKRSLEWSFLKTAGFLFSYEWTKTEVYENRDFINHTAHEPVRNAIVFSTFQRFTMIGRKCFKYTLRVDALCFENGEKISVEKNICVDEALG